ncbi:unnamed protein product (macronuclear) [Paramecium tetraurelia]|uniref:Uncharacterized protein n=1 Tax=Paramecium tetraurelia TaxID=5888 RepID=A0EHP8_PARTE|nr:uncharacterized protein GSPATT00027165001 [Paramecium tetraurelia]CAK94839.1 unnamed protein product [Paramecium tetraurelia]|eukprot:XP_001462212.1 hypothetical protein (macronuclear) [Paramecium tetraurelia strain d4-2]
MIINQLFGKLTESPNFKSISLIIKLFRLASQGDQDEDQPDQAITKYCKEPEDYSKIIRFSLLELPNILREFYQVDYADTFKREHIESHIHQVIIRGFLIKAMNFLEHTIETQEAQEDTILFVIRALEHLNVILTAFESLQKKALKLLIQVWGDHLSLQIKLQAFLQVRKVFQSMPDHQQQDILKKFYEKYLESAKHVLWRNYEAINFMINCVTELCNMNMNQAYQVVYLSLQKLVKKIRDASVSKNQQNVLSIYNQQTLYVLKLWAQVICTHKRENQLADLMPPFIQIAQSVLDFYPCIDNYTFQLQLIDILIKVSQVYKVNQNLLSYILRMLNCAELKRRKLKSSVKPYDFLINISIKPKYKQSGTFWADFCQQVVNRIVIYLSIFSNEKWFYEYTLFLEKQLKRTSEDFGFVGNKIKVKDLIRLIEQHNSKKGKGESNLQSEAQRLIYEQEELIKQKVMSEKQRQQAGEELEESEQEIDDVKEQEFVLDEIRKYKEDKKKDDVAQEDYEGLSEYEGDPENYQEEAEEQDDQDDDSDN